MYRTINNHLRPLFALFLLTITLGLMLLIAASAPLQAQTNQFDLPANGYFLKPDANNIVQLWQLPADGSEASILTNSATSLVDYAISNDGSQAAYTSDGQLWLLTIGETEAVALNSLAEGEAGSVIIIPPASHPLFSPDDSQIIYTDAAGLHSIPSAGGEATLLLENVALGANAEHADVARYFKAARFIPDTDLLVVNVLIWEGYTVGIVNLGTGDYQELPRAIHTEVLGLSNGELLIYGNGGVDGEFNLQIAPEYDLEQRESVLELLPLSEMPLYVQQAVEIEPGMVRVLGATIEKNGETIIDAYFYFDFDVEKRELVGEVISFPLLPSTAPETYTWAGKISPDGRILPHISNATVDNNSIQTGQITLHELAIGTIVDVAFQASQFQWR